MAKRKPVTPALESRTEVDETCERLCILDAEKRRLKADLDERITGLRAEFKPDQDKIAAEEKALKAQVQQWAVFNRAVEFVKSKSLSLIHAVLSFRTSRPAVKRLNSKWTDDSVLEAVCQRYTRYVRIKKELAGSRILADYAQGKITAEQLAEVGLKVTQRETFGIELKQESKDEAA